MKTRSWMAVLFVAALTATGASAVGVPQYVRNAPGAAEYPNDDGLLLRQISRIAMNPDGKVTRYEESALKMLTGYPNRHGYFDPRLSWNDKRSMLEVGLVRTYMADGTVVDAKENSLVYNTADALQWAVPYAHMREMVVAHVGVEHGATSVLGYSITDREPSGVPLWGRIELQSFMPVLEQEITIEVPENTTLHYACVDCEMEPEIEVGGGFRSYRFHRTRVPAVNTAELDGGHYGMEFLVYSVLEGWADVARYLERRVEEAAVVDSAVRAKTVEVLEEATLPIEQVGRIHSFVVDGVRTVNWPIEAFDFAVRPAGDVLASSVGHPLDKAVLLAAMLRSAAFEAHIALASSDPRIAEEVASPAQLDQAWVRVEVGTGEKWLDPAAGVDTHNQYHLLGYPVLVLDGSGAGIEVRRQAEARENRALLRTEINLEDGGHELLVSGFADLDLTMRYNSLVAYDREKSRHEGLAKRLAGAFGGAKMDAVHVGRQTCGLTSLRAEFSGGSLEVPRDGLVRLHLPRVPGGITGAGVQAERSERTMPFLVPGGPASERVACVITLPDGYEPAFLPKEATIENRIGSVRRSVELDGRTLTVTTSLRIEAFEVMPDAWPDLREMIRALEGDPAETVLLRRKG